MYSNQDSERFYFQYHTEAVPSGESIQSFCKRNNVPYNIFSKWYKDTRKRIVEVCKCPKFGLIANLDGESAVHTFAMNINEILSH